MKKLIVTADGAGSSGPVNDAIREAREKGVVTEVGFLASGPALAEAAAWAAGDVSLGKGIHLDLDRFFRRDAGKSAAHWELEDPRIPIDELVAEMERQMVALIAHGLTLHHLSSRNHLHLRPEILPAVCETARAFHLRAVRLVPSFLAKMPEVPAQWTQGVIARNGLLALPHYIDGWYWGNVDEKYIAAELACRPATDGEAGRADLAACCDANLKAHLRQQEIELTTFLELGRDGSRR